MVVAGPQQYRPPRTEPASNALSLKVPMFFNINNVFGYASDGSLIDEWANTTVAYF